MYNPTPVSILRQKAAKSGYSLSKGYQRFHTPGWGFRRDENGAKIVGYMLYDNSTDFAVWPSYNNLWDHALSLEEVMSLMNEMDILH